MAEKKNKEKVQGKGFKIIIIALLAVIIFGLAFTVGWLILDKKNSDESNKTVQSQTVNNNSLNPASEISSQTYALDDFLVNLADEGGKRFFKVKIFVGYEPAKKKEEDMIKELDAKKPVLRDSINSVLRSKKTTDLSTQKNIDDLKKEIITRVGSYFENGRINNIYLNDILIQ